jgi:hypothetical protein
MELDSQDFDISTIMNSGRIVRLKLNMESFPDRALSLPEFVTVM